MLSFITKKRQIGVLITLLLSFFSRETEGSLAEKCARSGFNAARGVARMGRSVWNRGTHDSVFNRRLVRTETSLSTRFSNERYYRFGCRAGLLTGLMSVGAASAIALSEDDQDNQYQHQDLTPDEKALADWYKQRPGSLPEGVFFIGVTGAGKSTTIASLLGAPLKYETVEGDTCVMLSPNATHERYPVISHDNAKSETRFPTVFKHTDGLCLVDCPGLKDTSDSDMVGDITFWDTMTSTKCAKIVFVVSYGEIKEGKGKLYKELVSHFAPLFSPETLDNSVLWVITKAPKGVTEENVLNKVSKVGRSFSEKLYHVMKHPDPRWNRDTAEILFGARDLEEYRMGMEEEGLYKDAQTMASSMNKDTLVLFDPLNPESKATFFRKLQQLRTTTMEDDSSLNEESRQSFRKFSERIMGEAIVQDFEKRRLIDRRDVIDTALTKDTSALEGLKLKFSRLSKDLERSKRNPDVVSLVDYSVHLVERRRWCSLNWTVWPYLYNGEPFKEIALKIDGKNVSQEEALDSVNKKKFNGGYFRYWQCEPSKGYLELEYVGGTAQNTAIELKILGRMRDKPSYTWLEHIRTGRMAELAKNMKDIDEILKSHLDEGRKKKMQGDRSIAEKELAALQGTFEKRKGVYGAIVHLSQALSQKGKGAESDFMEEFQALI